MRIGEENPSGQTISSHVSSHGGDGSSRAGRVHKVVGDLLLLLVVLLQLLKDLMEYVGRLVAVASALVELFGPVCISKLINKIAACLLCLVLEMRTINGITRKCTWAWKFLSETSTFIIFPPFPVICSTFSCSNSLAT